MNVSKQMIIGWLTLAIALLALPQFVALVPESALPIVTLIAGVLTLVVRWLGGQLGVNPLSVVGAGAIIAGLLAMPELLAVIPADWMPYVTGLVGVLQLLTRFYAGQQPNDDAQPVGFVLHKSW